jgi:hypothetical protein
MNKLRTLVLTACVFGLAGVANADNLDMDGMSPAQSDAHPKRGSTQVSVESKFGKPDATRAPVGDPPIERWEYKDFVVYFEYDRVIHTVAKR